MMSLSKRLITGPMIREKVVIGDFRTDIEIDREAEKIVKVEFPEIDVITSVEGNKLVPISSLLKLNQRLKLKEQQDHLEAINSARDSEEIGYTKGLKEGLERGEREAQKVIDNFASLIKSASSQRELLYEEARLNILDLIVEIARKITFNAVQIDPEVTSKIISGVIDKLVNKTNIKVKVHPDQYPLIEKQIDKFKGQSTAIREIVIEPDINIKFGGCFIETPTGNIDARVESQMEIIANSLENENGET